MTSDSDPKICKRFILFENHLLDSQYVSLVSIEKTPPTVPVILLLLDITPRKGVTLNIF